MAAVNHVDSSKNPYHYSFSLCASGNFIPASNYNANKGASSSNKTYYSYQARYETTPEFNCDLCDRAFKTEVQYNRHVSEHVTCGQDGCEFTAHPKVVAIHFRTQHETGLYHLIKKLNTPEEVKKWIEERKRKYPTKQNIQNQKLVEEDKIRRGEIIKPDNSRFNKKFSKRREHNFKDKQEFKPNQNKRRNKKVIPKLDTTQNDLISEKAVKEECNGVQAFQGLGGKDKNEVVKAIEEKPQKTLPAKNNTPLLVNKSLALLMTSYDSGAESDEDSPIPAPEKPKSDNSDSDSAPEEVKTIKSSVPHEIETESISRKRKFKRNTRKCPKRRKASNKVIQHNQLHRKQTLLEKLLHDQIVNERQFILSSIRCIVNNNFFDMGTKQKDTNPVLPMKSSLLEGLLKDEIIDERNMILQCIRHVVNNNFFEPSS